MNYLKDYNITEEQIKEIENVLIERKINVDLFVYDPEKIISILDLFVELGVDNLYDIIITSPSLFCDTLTSIKKRINSYENKEQLAKLLNEDAANLFLVDLM